MAESFDNQAKELANCIDRGFEEAGNCLQEVYANTAPRRMISFMGKIFDLPFDWVLWSNNYCAVRISVFCVVSATVKFDPNLIGPGTVF